MLNYNHGGDIYTREIEYDFSTNINPLGMPLAAISALRSNISALEAYPDVYCTELVKSISEHEGVSKNNILCGNGATDLIYRIIYAIKPQKALLITPTFSEYEFALRNIDCSITYEKLYVENKFDLTDTILQKIQDAEIFFLCNPNNPIGNLISPIMMEKIVNKCVVSETLLVVDECFLDFVIDAEDYTAKKYLKNGVIILKAFTKTYAMAGLRLGYIMCSNKKLIERFRQIGPCWNVSTAAQIAGVAALSDHDYILETRNYIAAERDYLSTAIESFGFKVYSSEANYIFFISALNLEKELLNHKIAIRNCRNYRGLGTGFFRVAVKTHEENIELINAIERILHNG